MGIEELVKKHSGEWGEYTQIAVESSIRAALTELAQGYDRKQALLLEAHCERVISLQERIRQLEAEREGMALVPRELLDKFPELNTSNYSHDDVDELNSWGIELVLAAAPQQKKEGSDVR